MTNGIATGTIPIDKTERRKILAILVFGFWLALMMGLWTGKIIGMRSCGRDPDQLECQP